MPSRLPPSQRSAAFGLHRLPAAVKQAFTGAGRVANATPVRQATVSRARPPAGGGGGAGLWVGDEEPTDGSVLWLDTDEDL